MGWGLCAPLFNMRIERSKDNWRSDPGLSFKIEYIKTFALFPKVCSDGTSVWLNYYYKKYEHCSCGDFKGVYVHTDFIEDVSEAEYIIRRLTEGF